MGFIILGVIAVGIVFARFNFGAYIGELFATAVFALVGFVLYMLVHRVWLMLEYLKRVRAEAARLRGEESAKLFGRMDPYNFERFVGVVLLNEGAQKVEVTSRSNDAGIDLRSEWGGRRVWLQVKRYQLGNNVGRVAVQQFVGSYEHQADEGWFITTSNFNDYAREYAALIPSLRLIDGAEFALMVDRLPSESWVDDFVVRPMLREQASSELGRT